MTIVVFLKWAYCTDMSDAGPLLWHFESNQTNDPSVELTLEEVKTLARKIGLEIKVGEAQ